MAITYAKATISPPSMTGPEHSLPQLLSLAFVVGLNSTYVDPLSDSSITDADCAVGIHLSNCEGDISLTSKLGLNPRALLRDFVAYPIGVRNTFAVLSFVGLVDH